MVLITYDVMVTNPGGQKRLRHVAKECMNYGQRVQNSVFECELDPAAFAVLKNKLENIIDKKADSLRFYYLGSNWERRVEHIGAKPAIDIKGPMIV
mgnify:CR=1 FL=1